MPVLPNGKWVDDDEYAEMQFQALASQTVPMSGSFLGTNYSFTPTTENVGLNLGWNAAPNLSAGFIFDPSVSSSNAYVSDYDVAASGMLPVGNYSSSNAELGFTAGIQGTDINDPNPYMNVGVMDVVPGLDVSTGTNIPSAASFSTPAIPGLDLSKVSGGPTEAAYSTEISPGVNLNLGTGQGGNIGVTTSGAWDDIGKVWGGIKDTLGNIISPAGAQTGTVGTGIEAASQAGAVQSKYGAGGYSGKLGPGDSYPAIFSGEEIVTPTSAGMAEVPTVDVTDQLSYSMRYPGFASRVSNMPGPVSTIGEATEKMDAQEKRDMEDAVHHLDAVYGGVTPGLPQAFQQGNTTTNLLDNATRFAQKWGLGAITTVLGNSGNVPADMLNDYLESLLDKRDPIGDGLDKSTSEIQDLINNRVFMDARRSDISKDQMLDSILNQTNTLVALDTSDTGPLAAAAMLSQDYGIPLTEDKVREMAFQVDTFKDIPAPVVTKTSRKDLKAAAAAQRKADLAEQKAAARRTALAKQALKDSQAAAARAQAASAAQAKSEQDKAKAVLARMNNDRNTPSQREINAALEVMTQVDTFGGGRIRGDRDTSGERSAGMGGGRGGFAGPDRW